MQWSPEERAAYVAHTYAVVLLVQEGRVRGDTVQALVRVRRKLLAHMAACDRCKTNMERPITELPTESGFCDFSRDLIDRHGRLVREIITRDGSLGPAVVIPPPQPVDPPRFCCVFCGMTSYNPNDIVHGWCGNCHGATRR